MKFGRLYRREYTAYISKPLAHLRLAKDGYPKKTIAQVVNRVRKGGDTYIMYSYSTDALDYLFAWITPYDEMHRSIGDHAKEWYDELTQDIEFEVSYDQKKPWLHKVETPKFTQLNQCNILLLGEK